MPVFSGTAHKCISSIQSTVKVFLKHSVRVLTSPIQCIPSVSMLSSSTSLFFSFFFTPFLLLLSSFCLLSLQRSTFYLSFFFHSFSSFFLFHSRPHLFSSFSFCSIFIILALCIAHLSNYSSFIWSLYFTQCSCIYYSVIQHILNVL